MQSNIQPFNKKNHAATKEPQTKALQIKVLQKRLVSSVVLLSFLGLGATLLAPKVHANDVAKAGTNLFEEKFVEQNDHQLKSLKASPDTTLELGGNQEADTTRMLENGYDMMGTSEFVSAKISAELAKTYAKKIKADYVLVYDRPTSLTTNMVNLDGTESGNKAIQEANAENAKNEKTVHYASYWAKLPMPLLGVHVIKLIKASTNPAEEGTPLPGLKIIAVIKESPAAKANIVTGDTLLQIGDVTLEKSGDLFAAVKRYQGQTVDIMFRHGDEDIKTTVALNSRK
ncbi:MAG: PDZ domain-containing protein [Methylotenera sp.]|uniref:PDZ domain-containing protein n=1 Tax=Methylotenera sp. TaxID=2051956 RepID=UPI0024897EC0|nr:PDZ domain-containing protein [Methylotenera sp.]MDI1310047.1 PDZ domain-containing protein [Methylotenera sp.]